jgi:hypothetical protein
MGFLGRILGPGDRDEFAAACMRALRKHDPACEPAYDAAAFALRLADGSRLNLHNAWDEVERETRGERAAMARRHALAFAVSRERVLHETWGRRPRRCFRSCARGSGTTSSGTAPARRAASRSKCRTA